MLLFGLALEGAWIGNLTRLAPYPPLLVRNDRCALGYRILDGLSIVAGGLLGGKMRLAAVNRWVKIGLGLATVVVSLHSVSFYSPLIFKDVNGEHVM